MRNIRNCKTVFSGIAVIALLSAATIIVAEGTTSKKSTYGHKIEAIMVDYVAAIQSSEKAYDKKMTPVIKVSRATRDGAVTKAGAVLLAKLERAAKDSKRLGRTADAKLAEAERVEFKELVERTKAADPKKPETEDELEVVVKKPPLESHLMLGGHAYLAIAGMYSHADAAAICRRIGGHLAYIDSARELLLLQKGFPVGHTLWIGAADYRHTGRWHWLNGKVVKAGCWSRGHPRASKRKTLSRFWSNVTAALTRSGMVSRDGDSKCRGFICEWDR